LPERIIIPTEDQNGLNSRLAGHFGRAPYFAVVDLEDNKEISNVETVSNVGEHAGGRGHAHDNILRLMPQVVIVYGMGPRGLMSFQNAGIAVLRANADTVTGVIDAYRKNELQELTDGCQEAHHH